MLPLSWSQLILGCVLSGKPPDVLARVGREEGAFPSRVNGGTIRRRSRLKSPRQQYARTRHQSSWQPSSTSTLTRSPLETAAARQPATTFESAKSSVPSTRCSSACRRAFGVGHFASSASLAGWPRCGPVTASNPDQLYYGHESSQAT